MKVAVLTSSRADYAGIAPLLKELSKTSSINFSIIAFGTHASDFHGYTVSKIKEDGYEVEHLVESMVMGDSPEAISTAIGLTVIKFAGIWSKSSYDLIITTGDRYEMFAAALASVSFNIPLAHIHGGEDTEGAIDNIFRHSLTIMSKYHFATTEQFKDRIIQIKKDNKNVFAVGALSIDAMKTTKLLTVKEFHQKFNIDLSIPTVLITLHPETASLKENKKHIDQFIKSLSYLHKYQLVITMPNADTMGNVYRQKLKEFITASPNAVGVESFGNLGYFSCMKYCKFMLGNSSSGFVEASYFPKYVINTGDRQKGRIITPNIISCELSEKEIVKAFKKVEDLSAPKAITIYGDGNSAKKIVNVLKRIK